MVKRGQLIQMEHHKRAQSTRGTKLGNEFMTPLDSYICPWNHRMGIPKCRQD